MIGVTMLDNLTGWRILVLVLFAGGIILGWTLHSLKDRSMYAHYGMQTDVCAQCKHRVEGVQTGLCFDCACFDTTKFRPNDFEPMASELPPGWKEADRIPIKKMLADARKNHEKLRIARMADGQAEAEAQQLLDEAEEKR